MSERAVTSPAGRLARAVQELSLAGTVEDIQEVVRHTARDLAHADGATVVLKEGECCFYADEDAISPLWKGQRFPLTACVSGWAMMHKQTVVIPDIYADERVPHDAYRPTFVRSMVMVPIRSLDPLGAVGTYWAVTRKPTREEIALLEALADSTAVAFANVAAHGMLADRSREDAENRRHAVTDELTGLPNRRGFRLLGEQALEPLRRNGRDAVVLFVDLDGLKAINDSLGHAVGDLLLQDVATALQRVFREEDLVARLGGDEFAVLTVGDHLDEAHLIHRLREETAAVAADRPQRHPLANRGLSASIGAASYRPEATLTMLLAQADAAMYHDKKRKAVPVQRSAAPSSAV